jgi:cardiolipin synthase
MRIEKLEAAPSVVSKINTFAQILLVLAVMLSQSFRQLPSFWMDLLIYCVLFTTLWSGFDYVWTWGRRAWLRRAH